MNRRRAVILAVGLSGAFVFAGAAQADDAKPRREINLTADSAPGWLPTPEQSDLAEKTARAYLAAEYSGDVKTAYAYLTDTEQQQLPFEQFSPALEAFVAEAGADLGHDFLRTTWTKDPADAPYPGIYVAIDLVNHFQHIARHCGYVVLYQRDAGADFHVMREEANFIDDEQYDGIVRDRGKTYADATWTSLAANCPNYPPVVP